MPPSVQWLCVDGSGAKVRLMLLGARCAASSSTHARLDTRAALLRVDLEDAVQVLGEVDDHGDVAALAGTGSCRRRARGSARRAHGRPRRSAITSSMLARHDDADRHLAVVRGVGGVERAAAGVEAHLAVDARAQVAIRARARHRPRRRARALAPALSRKRAEAAAPFAAMAQRAPPLGGNMPSHHSLADGDHDADRVRIAVHQRRQVVLDLLWLDVRRQRRHVGIGDHLEQVGRSAAKALRPRPRRSPRADRP